MTFLLVKLISIEVHCCLSFSILHLTDIDIIIINKYVYVYTHILYMYSMHICVYILFRYSQVQKSVDTLWSSF